MDGEVFNTMNFPPLPDYTDDWLEDDRIPQCIVCGAPYHSCTDIIFTNVEGVNNNG